MMMDKLIQGLNLNDDGQERDYHKDREDFRVMREDLDRQIQVAEEDVRRAEVRVASLQRTGRLLRESRFDVMIKELFGLLEKYDKRQNALIENGGMADSPLPILFTATERILRDGFESEVLPEGGRYKLFNLIRYFEKGCFKDAKSGEIVTVFGDPIIFSKREKIEILLSASERRLSIVSELSEELFKICTGNRPRRIELNLCRYRELPEDCAGCPLEQALNDECSETCDETCYSNSFCLSVGDFVKVCKELREKKSLASYVPCSH